MVAAGTPTLTRRTPEAGDVATATVGVDTGPGPDGAVRRAPLPPPAAGHSAYCASMTSA